jgi:hypothetical protein
MSLSKYIFNSLKINKMQTLDKLPKIHSSFRFMLEYFLIAFIGYLLLSLCISIIGDYNYREVLKSENHIYAIWLIYWWLPIPRMIDMSNHNDAVKSIYLSMFKKSQEIIEKEIIDVKKEETEIK